jgi:hypothetical protein
VGEGKHVKLTIETDAKKLKENFEGAASRFDRAITAAANMAASMIVDQSKADIASAGAFGDDFTSGLHAAVEKTGSNIQISITHDDPRAALFENGGKIEGQPLLWLPLSGTDAEGVRAGEYPGGLFSVQRRDGLPLLFSISDKLPRYFGIESVTVPKKFHIHEIAISVMQNFRQIFDAQNK